MERFGEGQGAEQEMKGHGRTTERQREVELRQKQGAEMGRGTERAGVRGQGMALPPSRD